MLHRYGFEIVDMGAMPVAAQISLAHSAAVLSGPHGAGFVHTLFMSPKSTVIECYSPLFINQGIIQICLAMQHRYFMLVYENAHVRYPFGNQLMVNCAHLELTLQSLG
jgi:capsular polysaccharide biosynthesis protein